MNFEKLPTIEPAAFYVDVAFRRGSEAASSAKDVRGMRVRVTKLDRLRRADLARVQAVTQTLIDNAERIKQAFPVVDKLPPFYRELAQTALDMDAYRQGLYRIGRVKAVLLGLRRKYGLKLRGARDDAAIHTTRKEFLGRAASVIKDVSGALTALAAARQSFKSFPDIRTDVPTVVIAGFPNVGKSTLLKALTGSAPEIAPYPFTTKQLMVGYRRDGTVVQYIDTPGLLDRPLAKRNPVERHAILALKHLATLVLFVVDASESCGFAIGLQLRLARECRDEFPRLLFAVSKQDLARPEQLEHALRELPGAIVIAAEKAVGIPVLLDAITKALKPSAP
jgi:nucleolar GTP-binding protein